MSDIYSFSPLWGEWYIKDLIGEGSFSSVYRIEKKEYGSTYVSAVKHISVPEKNLTHEKLIEDGVVSDMYALPAFYDNVRDQLINEIKFCYALRGHTNIVSYEDHCIIPKKDGLGYDIFIRMELLTALPKYMRTHQMTESDVIQLGIDICSALEVLCARNMLHRDIKPANIFVTDMGIYKLGDFGESKVLSNAPTCVTVRGTYAYMPPEISRSDTANITADIYSLGLVMYRLLNGNRPPFIPPASTSISAQMQETANTRRFKGEPLPVPSNCKNSGLAGIILKACEFFPQNRWQSPESMKEQLTALKKAIKTNGSANSAPAYTAPNNMEMQMPAYVNAQQNMYYSMQQAAAMYYSIRQPMSMYAAAQNMPIPQNVQPSPEPDRNPHLKNDPAAAGQSDGFASKILGKDQLISAGEAHVVGIMPDSSVAAKGLNMHGQCKVSEWKEIISVSAGRSHTIGLRENGIVAAQGWNEYGQCNTLLWKDIAAVSAGSYHTVGLKKDGTVIAAGLNKNGQCNVSDWNNIVRISAGRHFTVGVKSDGTVVSTDGTDLTGWKNIAAVSAGKDFIIGLKNDGTVVSTSDADLSGWNRIIAVSAGGEHIIGLKADGTVVAAGDDKYSQCDVSGWKDIAAVSAGEKFTVGLKKDGTVVAAGLNSRGQCDVSGWKLKTP